MTINQFLFITVTYVLYALLFHTLIKMKSVRHRIISSIAYIPSGEYLSTRDAHVPLLRNFEKYHWWSDLMMVEKDIVEKHHQQTVIGQTFVEVGGTAVIERWCTNRLVLSGLMALNELLLLFLPIGTYAYISESWAMLTSDRPSSPKCVDIPRNLTLCYGIQVSKQHRKPYPSHPSITLILSWISLFRTIQSPFPVQNKNLHNRWLISNIFLLHC